MDAKELRIGNYIEPITKSPCTVTGVNLQKVKDGDLVFIYADYQSFLPEHIHPIELTPEWLERLGFKLKKGTPANSEMIYCDFEVRIKDFRIYVAESPTELKQSSIHIKSDSRYFPELAEFGYVHQLQNLYFALTGEELTLSEPKKITP